MKKILNRTGLAALAAVMLSSVACSDFLSTAPLDQLSPTTTWKTEADAQAFLVGVYNNAFNMDAVLYMDCATDIGYNFHFHEGYEAIAAGTMTPGSDTRMYWRGYYNFESVQRCNIFLANIDNVEFTSETTKKNMIAQVRTIRANRYFLMNWLFGGVPIIDFYPDADAAKVPRNTAEEVKQYIYTELTAAIPDLPEAPAARGYWARGAAQALLARVALFYGDWQRAADAAQAVMNMNRYSLDASFANIFSLAGQSSAEIILAHQRIANTAGNGYLGMMYNNSSASGAGWSSMVPTQNLVDMYEMTDGLTKEESPLYDATHPYANRDPRMAATVVYPGADFNGHIVNTLDQTLPGGSKNLDYPTAADNSSKTALTWGKYLTPITQYSNIWNTGACLIVFRYAEVLLTYAEAKNELSGPSTDVYDAIDKVRTRAGMPAVDQARYATKETLRELIRRERTVELAGEGFRRADIIRWKDASGKLLAETVLNGNLTRPTGTVNYDEADPTKRATITGTELVNARKFSTTPHSLLPIPQAFMDQNPQLVQNPGY